MLFIYVIYIEMLRFKSFLTRTACFAHFTIRKHLPSHRNSRLANFQNYSHYQAQLQPLQLPCLEWSLKLHSPLLVDALCNIEQLESFSCSAFTETIYPQKYEKKVQKRRVRKRYIIFSVYFVQVMLGIIPTRASCYERWHCPLKGLPQSLM